MFDDGRIETNLKYENDFYEGSVLRRCPHPVRRHQQQVNCRVLLRSKNVRECETSHFDRWRSNCEECQVGPPNNSRGCLQVCASLHRAPNHGHAATTSSSPNPALSAIAGVRFVAPSNSVTAGDDVRLVIELDRAAPRGGLVVLIDSVTTTGLSDTLRTASGEALIALTSFKFDEGARSVPILIKTKRVTDDPTVVTFTVRSGNSQKNATLTVR